MASVDQPTTINALIGIGVRHRHIHGQTNQFGCGCHCVHCLNHQALVRDKLLIVRARHTKSILGQIPRWHRAL